MAMSPDDPRRANLKPGNRRGPNKTTKALKEAILQAAEEVGFDGEGEDGLVGYLRAVAMRDHKAMAGLLGKVLPLTVAGDPEAPVKLEVVWRAPSE